MRRVEDRKTYKIEEAGRLLGIGRNQAYEAARRSPRNSASNRDGASVIASACSTSPRST